MSEYARRIRKIKVAFDWDHQKLSNGKDSYTCVAEDCFLTVEGRDGEYVACVRTMEHFHAVLYDPIHRVPLLTAFKEAEDACLVTLGYEVAED